MLFTCQPGYEPLLSRELAERKTAVAEKGAGWVSAGLSAVRSPQSAIDLAFAHQILFAPHEVRGESVNALAQRIAEIFFESLRGERIDSAWPCVFAGPAEIVGLGRRLGGVEQAFHELLKKRLSRVAKLASPELPRGAREVRGLFVRFVDFGRAFVAREAWLGGQRRMADDEQAPSRSYLKVEEAYGVLGREPQAGETVADLGAAPGGWSYSAAKRGAHVVAVDNGPLKGGARKHPNIRHFREDAFRFRPSFAKVYPPEAAPEATRVYPPEAAPQLARRGGATRAAEGCDWLFCDLVEEPHHVVRDIVEPWLAQRWCRRFVINLKFGRADPIALLRELRAPESPLTRHTGIYAIRHLYHDREEFTLVGRSGV